MKVTMELAPATLPNGFLFADRYEIQGEMGSGGFSRVYQARQVSTGQSVAIKLLYEREGSELSTGSEGRRGQGAAITIESTTSLAPGSYVPLGSAIA